MHKRNLLGLVAILLVQATGSSCSYHAFSNTSPSPSFANGLAPNSRAEGGAARRKPANSGLSRNAALADLNKRSSGAWTFRWRPNGTLSRMSGASISLGTQAPIAAAGRFLEAYSQGLLGVEPNSLTQTDLRREDTTTQVIYQQSIAGLPIFGSRVNVYLDRDGSLVYAAFNIYTGPAPTRNGGASPLAAAGILKQALMHYLENGGIEVHEDAYSVEFLEGRAISGFRVKGENQVNIAYRYEFTLGEGSAGQMEALVDAQEGALVYLRPVRSK